MAAILRETQTADEHVIIPWGPLKASIQVAFHHQKKSHGTLIRWALTMLKVPPKITQLERQGRSRSSDM